MKWYLVRNRTSDTLTMNELLNDAAKGQWFLRGYQRSYDSEELFNALAKEGLFEAHSEVVVRILEQNDKAKGVFIEEGLYEGDRSRFIVKRIDSPRFIWSKRPQIDMDEADANDEE